MSDKKPKKIRRRRTPGRVAGTTQSAFASNSMSSILKQQTDDQAGKKAKKKTGEAEKNEEDE